LAALCRESGADERSHRLLAEAVAHYAAHGDASLAAGDRADAQLVADNLAAVLPELGDADRRAVGGRIEDLQARLVPRR